MEAMLNAIETMKLIQDKEKLELITWAINHINTCDKQADLMLVIRERNILTGENISKEKYLKRH